MKINFLLKHVEIFILLISNVKNVVGRTMDFTFDLSQTPVIGRRYLIKSEEKVSQGENSAASPRRSVSLSPADNASIAGWKRPWMSQVTYINLYTISIF